MSRIAAIQPDAATGKAQELFTAVAHKLGLVPNMTRVMAQSPSVLEGYLALSGALSKGSLPAKVREQIALAVAEANGCDYCLAAHSAVGKMVGLTADQIIDSRHATSVEPKTEALLKLTHQVVAERGRVSDADIAAARDAGVSDVEIVEVVGQVALNLFTNYFNIVADTEVDFPRAPALPVGS